MIFKILLTFIFGCFFGLQPDRLIQMRRNKQEEEGEEKRLGGGRSNSGFGCSCVPPEPLRNLRKHRIDISVPASGLT